MKRSKEAATEGGLHSPFKQPSTGVSKVVPKAGVASKLAQSRAAPKALESKLGANKLKQSPAKVEPKSKLARVTPTTGKSKPASNGVAADKRAPKLETKKEEVEVEEREQPAVEPIPVLEEIEDGAEPTFMNLEIVDADDLRRHYPKHDCFYAVFSWRGHEQRTEISEGPDPRWNEQFALPFTARDEQEIEIKLFSDVPNFNETIGSCVISFENAPEEEEEYPLPLLAHADHSRKGQLRIRLYKETSKNELNDVEDTKEESAQEQDEQQKGELSQEEGSVEKDWAEEKSPEELMLMVTVMGAINLGSMDGEVPTNSYVQFNWRGSDQRTDIKKDRLNPQWNMTFELPFDAENDPSNLQLRVFNEDQSEESTLLGSVNIDLSETYKIPVEQWFLLEGMDTNAKLGVILHKLEGTVADKDAEGRRPYAKLLDEAVSEKDQDGKRVLLYWNIPNSKHKLFVEVNDENQDENRDKNNAFQGASDNEDVQRKRPRNILSDLNNDFDSKHLPHSNDNNEQKDSQFMSEDFEEHDESQVSKSEYLPPTAPPMLFGNHSNPFYSSTPCTTTQQEPAFGSPRSPQRILPLNISHDYDFPVSTSLFHDSITCDTFTLPIRSFRGAPNGLECYSKQSSQQLSTLHSMPLMPFNSMQSNMSQPSKHILQSTVMPQQAFSSQQSNGRQTSIPQGFVFQQLNNPQSSLIHSPRVLSSQPSCSPANQRFQPIYSQTAPRTIASSYPTSSTPTYPTVMMPGQLSTDNQMLQHMSQPLTAKSPTSVLQPPSSCHHQHNGGYFSMMATPSSVGLVTHRGSLTYAPTIPQSPRNPTSSSLPISSGLPVSSSLPMGSVMFPPTTFPNSQLNPSSPSPRIHSAHCPLCGSKPNSIFNQTIVR